MSLFSDMNKKQADTNQKRRELKAEKQRIKNDPELALKDMKEKLGIDFESYTDEQLLEKNSDNVERLRRNTIMRVWMDLATNLSGASNRDLYDALRAITEQNFIIIRQNEQIVRELKRLK